VSTITTMEFWVFDLASLRYRSDRGVGRLSVLTAAGELLAAVGVENGTSEREAVFRALDAALAHGRLIRPEGTMALAFLNPYSSQIAVGAVPETVSYQSADQVRLSEHGARATLRDGLMEIDGHVLVPVTPDMSSVMEALTAHRD
jgi:hypothetical protein